MLADLYLMALELGILQLIITLNYKIMAKSLLSTVVNTSKEIKEQKEKTKRAQLRREAAEAREEAEEARIKVRSTSAEAKLYEAQAKQIKADEKARAARLQQNLEYKAKIDSYVFDVNDIPKCMYQLTELQSEVQNEMADGGVTGERFTMAYNKFKLGVKLLEMADPDNYLLQECNSTLDEVKEMEQENYKKEHYLSYRIKDRDIKTLVDDYAYGREKDAAVLLDALVTLDQALDACNQLGTGSDFTTYLRPAYKRICKQAISLHPNDEELMRFIEEHKHKLYRVQKIVLSVFGVLFGMIGILFIVLAATGQLK